MESPIHALVAVCGLLREGIADLEDCEATDIHEIRAKIAGLATILADGHARIGRAAECSPETSWSWHPRGPS